MVMTLKLFDRSASMSTSKHNSTIDPLCNLQTSFHGWALMNDRVSIASRAARPLRALCAGQVWHGLSGVRYDTTFGTQEVMRDASNPTVGSLQQAKRIARYLKGTPRCVLSFPKSTWAGWRTTEKTVEKGLSQARDRFAKIETYMGGSEEDTPEVERMQKR